MCRAAFLSPRRPASEAAVEKATMRVVVVVVVMAATFKHREREEVRRWEMECRGAGM